MGPRRAERLRELALNMRERYAAHLYDRETVAYLITEKAAEGHRSVRLAQSMPFALEETKAARELLAWLKKEDFRVRWAFASHSDELRRGVFDEPYCFHELVIEW